MRKLLNKMLLPFRYRIEKVPRFAILLDRLASRVGAPKFVQVGANDGVRFDGLFQFVTERKCSGLAIEPLPDMFARLRMNYQDYPGVIPVNVAVHPTMSEATIYRVDPQQIGSFPAWASGIASLDPRHHEKSGIPRSAIIAETVACTPLMSLLSAHGMLDAQLLQIDTEGFDAEVIRMIDFSRFKPLLIKYEHRHLSPDDAASAKSILSGQGYGLVAEGSDMLAYPADL